MALKIIITKLMKFQVTVTKSQRNCCNTSKWFKNQNYCPAHGTSQSFGFFWFVEISSVCFG